MKIKDRIKEFKRVPASELIPNPKNWRTHPDSQADALKGILAEVGWADACLVMETEDGLQLIDGHLRAEVAPDSMIPVLVLDVTPEEADKILATHDPLAAMAEANAEKLEALLDEMETDSEAMMAMLDQLKEEVGICPPDFAPVSADEQGRLDEKAKVKCPKCGEEF